VALDVTAIAVRGRWVKHTYPGSPPLPERDPPPDNRWQRGTGVDALYLADSEETAWAEWYRHLAERAIPPLAQMPRELWTWQVDVEVADLSTVDKLAAVGLGPPTPGRHVFVPRPRRRARSGAESSAAANSRTASASDGASDLIPVADSEALPAGVMCTISAAETSGGGSSRLS
jgi:hypothetical protein